MSVRPQRHALVLSAAAALALAPGCHAVPGSLVAEAEGYRSIGDQVLVKFQPRTPGADQKALRDRYHVEAADPLLPLIERWRLPSGSNPVAVATQLASEPAIMFAQPNYLRHTLVYTIPSGTQMSSQWYLSGTNGFDVSAAWSRCSTNPPGAGVTVAVVDTGVDTSHPDLAPNIASDPNGPGGKRFIDEVGDGPKTPNNPNGTDVNYHNKDGNGHGTHVAGILGAAGISGGTIGVAPGVKILPVKTMQSDGDGDDFTIAKGLKAAADNGADVINLSVGGPAPSPILAEAIAYDFTKGATVVIAAGNQGVKVYYPAAYSGVIAVGATITNRAPASYSNFGPELSLMAPGGDSTSDAASVGILSTFPTYPCNDTINYGKPNYYAVEAGTSMATPMVSGAAALVIAEARARGQSLTPSQVRMRLLASATPLGSTGFDPHTGYGFLNPAAALTWVTHDGANH